MHRGFGDQVKLWLFVRIQYIKGSAPSIPSILAIKPQVMLMHLSIKPPTIPRESLFGGMEWWNGTVEWNSGMEWWNSGMTTPIERLL